ncbi:hypothetical protein NPIL_408591, partial [Nephila pilipes]
MFFSSVQVHLALVLFATGIFAQSGENNDFFSVFNCISSSKNQTLCDEFLICRNLLPLR